MSLDQPASSVALWSIYSATGIRPEFLIVVLANESGLNPAAPNSAGAPQYGIGQNSTALITAKTGMTPVVYMQQLASYQLQKVVLPYFAQYSSPAKPLRSGCAVYQVEYCPASLSWAPHLDSIITSPTFHPECSYSANAVFDTAHKGYITVRDLANAIAKQAATTAVKNAIAAAYTNAPFGVGPPQDPVFGNTNSLFTERSLLTMGGILLISGLIAHHVDPSFFSASSTSLRRRLHLT